MNHLFSAKMTDDTGENNAPMLSRVTMKLSLAVALNASPSWFAVLPGPFGAANVLPGAKMKASAMPIQSSVLVVGPETIQAGTSINTNIKSFQIVPR